MGTNVSAVNNNNEQSHPYLPIPTPTPVNNTQDSEDDDVTVVTSNRSNDRQTSQIPSQHNPPNDPPNHISAGTPTRPLFLHPHRYGTPVTRTQTWKQTIDQMKLKDKMTTENHDLAMSTLKIKIAVDQAIADAGTTGHFVLPGTPVENVQPATNPLTINLPDG